MYYLISRVIKEQPLRFTLSVLALAVAGLLEGVGIAALVPMLQIVGQGNPSASTVGTAGKLIIEVLDTLHLSFTLGTVLAFTLISILASQAAVLVQQKLLAGSSARLEATLRKRLYGSALEAGWPYFVRTKSSDLMSALLTDTARAGLAYVVLVTMIGTLIMVCVYLVLALFLSWQMTLAVLITSSAVLFLLRQRTRQGTKYGQAISVTDAEIHGQTQESLVAAKLVKASAAERGTIERFNALNNIRQRIQYKNAMNQGWLQALYGAASITTVFVGIYLAVTFFGMTISKLTVFLFVFYRLSPRVSNLQSNQSQVLSLIPSLRRVDESTRIASSMREASGTQRLSQLQEAIGLEAVSFAYVDNPVLHDLSLQIPCGSTTAIVGPSGSGKTTVMDLILGLLVPQSGDVTIDGVPLTAVRLADWRRQIGYVEQDSSFFHASVAENIGWGLDNVCLDDIKDAARLAHADEFIDELADGYGTIIGDRGVRLSGGQRQRLALARALVRKPAVLVLDEATSALDAKSEERVQRAVDDLAGRMTILTVTHRLATVKKASLIHVLENGSLVESGTWAELLARRGRFYELAEIQDLATHRAGPA